MRLRYLLTWLALLPAFFAQAQNTGTITGLVRDRATQELLPSVTVVLEGTERGAATTDGQPIRPDGSNGIPLLRTNDDPIVTPTLGFILEF